MLNFVLCDDNPHILEKFKVMLESIILQDNFNAEVKYTTTNAEDLLHYTENNPVDALFLDIHLKDKMSRFRSCRKNQKKQ